MTELEGLRTHEHRPQPQWFGCGVAMDTNGDVTFDWSIYISSLYLFLLFAPSMPNHRWTPPPTSVVWMWNSINIYVTSPLFPNHAWPLQDNLMLEWQRYLHTYTAPLRKKNKKKEPQSYFNILKTISLSYECNNRTELRPNSLNQKKNSRMFL